LLVVFAVFSLCLPGFLPVFQKLVDKHTIPSFQVTIYQFGKNWY